VGVGFESVGELVNWFVFDGKWNEKWKNGMMEEKNNT